MLEDYSHVIALLKLMVEESESMARDAKIVYEAAVKIRKRSEETEALIDECLALLDE